METTRTRSTATRSPRTAQRSTASRRPTRTSAATSAAATTPAAPSLTPTALAEANLPLVRSIAGSISRSTGGLMPVDDLIAVGVQAVLEIAGRFDGSQGKFSTFAYWRIRGSMLDSIANFAPLPRGAHRSNRANVDGRRAKHHVASFDQLEAGLGETPTEPVDPATALDAERSARRLQAALRRLPTGQRVILRRHYFGEESLLDIGRSMGRSKSWASRLHTLSIDGLRQALREVA